MRYDGFWKGFTLWWLKWENKMISRKGRQERKTGNSRDDESSLEVLHVKEIEFKKDRSRAGEVGGCESAVVVSVWSQILRRGEEIREKMVVEGIDRRNSWKNTRKRGVI